MNTICGNDCGSCPSRDDCRGCLSTCGSPFGGKCIAAEFIRLHSLDSYHDFKLSLLRTLNNILQSLGLPVADALYELRGACVNLEYPLPSGEKHRFLDDRNIYLGTQVIATQPDLYYGVITDGSFVLIASYHADGSDPSLLHYRTIL